MRKRDVVAEAIASMKGEVKRLEAAIKALESCGSAPVERPRRRARKRYSKGASEAVLRALETYSKADVLSLSRVTGIDVGRVRGAIGNLRTKGQVESVRPGLYRKVA